MSTRTADETLPVPGRWQRFWEQQSEALAASVEAQDYDRFARELMLLFDGRERGRVLEIGCGDGVLFDALGFDRAERYLGVDYSASMLESFREHHGEADLRCASGHDFGVAEEFDLIFSSATVQYFTPDMVEAHLEAARAMIADDGAVVIASMPWRRMRWAYARNDVARRPRRPLPVATLAHLRRRFGFDTMGYWYDLPEVERMARRAGFDVTTYGSLLYLYRVHFVLHPR